MMTTGVHLWENMFKLSKHTGLQPELNKQDHSIRYYLNTFI